MKLQSVLEQDISCIEAFFDVVESINHINERGSTAFGCPRDALKVFDTIWTDGLLYQFFEDFKWMGKGGHATLNDL